MPPAVDITRVSSLYVVVRIKMFMCSALLSTWHIRKVSIIIHKCCINPFNLITVSDKYKVQDTQFMVMLNARCYYGLLM